MSYRLLLGDCRDTLRTLPDQSVHCVVTSPPYFGLRDYGTAKWAGGDPDCKHLAPLPGGHTASGLANYQNGLDDEAIKAKVAQRQQQYRDHCHKCGATRVDQQIGLETTPAEFVSALVEVFQEVKRILRDDGTLWLNMGDSYASGGRKTRDTVTRNKGNVGAAQSHRAIDGGKPKDLLGIPWRVAFALQEDGWFLRQDIIWQKLNPMPESVRDRCTKSHEYLFMLTKSPRYYFDADAIREPWAQRPSDINRAIARHPGYEGKHSAGYNGGVRGQPVGNPTAGRNKRSVWTVTTKPFKGAHFAVFPPDLIAPCILAGTSARGHCPECGTRQSREKPSRGAAGEWRAACDCGADLVPDVVLDPFGGSGTTAGVALAHGRHAVICELNPQYAEMVPARVEEVRKFYGLPSAKPENEKQVDLMEAVG